MYNIESLEQIVTGRAESFFKQDLNSHREQLRDAFADRSILIIGAAGSIGTAVTKLLLEFPVANIKLVDINENDLVEVVRDIRSSDLGTPKNLTSHPIDFGSPEFAAFMKDSPKFDYIFNLAALKHVRSEKDIYSISRMLKVNVGFVDQLLGSLDYDLKKYFSVSSDKAVDPANIMGASKLLMERCLIFHSDRHPASTARFANVAFSKGSLPYGFLHRLQKNQPLSGPKDIKRYFISHREAAELCVLSGGCGDNNDVFYPKFEEGFSETTFWEIAQKVLVELGYEPFECSSEEEAKKRLPELAAKKKWPCFFTSTATSGEKPYEEFNLPHETLDLERFEAIGVVKQDAEALRVPGTRDLITEVGTILSSGLSKADLVLRLKDVFGAFNHVETGRNLDEIM